MIQDAFSPVTLEGRHVRLEPLSWTHQAALAALALDPDLWQWTLTRLHSLKDLREYIASALALQDAGSALPFAIVDRATGTVIGSTRFGNIDRANRRVEIGWSWLGRPYHRQAFNTEAKLLMFEHAFERLDCVRVEFRVLVDNQRSRTAVERLGARFEGILRHQQIAPDGRLLDWAYYSVLREEWPEVRTGLEGKLAAHAVV
jgi:N-acetyltransferase